MQQWNLHRDRDRGRENESEEKPHESREETTSPWMTCSRVTRQNYSDDCWSYSSSETSTLRALEPSPGATTPSCSS
jgi:hypothetical protein